MGNGAFLLVKREAYEKTGGHRTLKMEVVEDLCMGLLMRSYSYKCTTALGLHRMKRRWQPGFLCVFKGLLKNFFAGCSYDISKTFGGILLFPFIFIVPWVLLFTSFWIVGLANILLLLTCYILASRISLLPWLSGFLLSPFLSLVASANLTCSMFLTLKAGGIRWRNTLYSLADLKAHKLTPKKAFAKGRIQ